ncbi:unnamed protein product [Paramecium pentaurelia]|uniref:Uncharacterized protein n=1 Tax=Paramecium pentaurelia TaxID=43138 RepID=A0A8S1YSC2_9CILI|nr:unnamed protein product [Paramecium pentaurelia]
MILSESKIRNFEKIHKFLIMLKPNENNSNNPQKLLKERKEPKR